MRRAEKIEKERDGLDVVGVERNTLQTRPELGLARIAPSLVAIIGRAPFT
jgi:hypothetical protein